MPECGGVRAGNGSFQQVEIRFRLCKSVTIEYSQTRQTDLSYGQFKQSLH